MMTNRSEAIRDVLLAVLTVVIAATWIWLYELGKYRATHVMTSAGEVDLRYGNVRANKVRLP